MTKATHDQSAHLQQRPLTGTDLHAAIMNLPTRGPKGTIHTDDYLTGHRDARHAAAELVARPLTGREPTPTLHPNHLPDLRYIRMFLLGLADAKHRSGDLAAALNGIDYIIKRTEEATRAPSLPVREEPTPAVQPPEFQEATWGVDSVMRPCKSMAVSEYAFRQWAKDVGVMLAASPSTDKASGALAKPAERSQSGEIGSVARAQGVDGIAPPSGYVSAKEAAEWEKLHPYGVGAVEESKPKAKRADFDKFLRLWEYGGALRAPNSWEAYQAGWLDALAAGVLGTLKESGNG